MRKPTGSEPGSMGEAGGLGSPAAPTSTTKDATPLSTVVRVRSLLPSLPPAERRVAQRVIDDPEGVANSTITELAQACGTSETTVIRFCRAIGFHGYPELRLTLATEAGRAQTATGGRIIGSDISPDDSLEQVVEKVTFADARAVEETASQLDIKMLEQVVDAVVAADRVDVYGVGASAFVALDFQQKLHRIGMVCAAWSDAHIMLTSAAVLGPGDVAIGISHTGATVETIDALEVAKGKGVTTVALTNFPKSPIAEVADLMLTTAARETTFRSGATASRLAQLTVVDCVFVGVAQRTFGTTRKALEATFEAVRGRTVRPDRRRR
ncbi:MurR/RpiR family transcriptional regulator [Actinomadura viridis]|uniref:DNA-binding MurR/RpiR family transcriptional regulator n=2 Tax=Actinomadura viridis TaxID=58110 RepID=A0A931DFX0_9ACTN|nr:MurR/RpiR family transcriptional regulator [Actinomadura viridis]MBG6086741.1 DNA-binding MurR/RpiR family transcriptional regulator [Actinomadura viridis]